MNDQHRDAERVPLSEEVTGEVSLYEPMTILDLSERGALVETRFPLHLGSLHEFRLLLRGLPIIVKGRIVHSQVGGLEEGAVAYRTGVEFVELSDHALIGIRGFVDRQKLGRPGMPRVIDAELADDV
jgi:PilZ domain-containing protein